MESSGTKQKPEQEKSTVPVGIPTELPFKVKSEAKSKRRQFKPVKKIIEGEGYDKMPLDVPTSAPFPAQLNRSASRHVAVLRSDVEILRCCS